MEIPDKLDEALKRARVVADAETAPSVLTIQKGTVRIITETHMGTVKDVVKMDGHPDVEASVSAKLVHRIIKDCTSMSVLPNGCAFKNGDKLFIFASNMS